MNVGQLKKFLEQLDDNVQIVVTSDNFELNGSAVGAHAVVDSMVRVQKQFRDSFDGIEYHTSVWTHGDDEQMVVRICG